MLTIGKAGKEDIEQMWLLLALYTVVPGSKQMHN